MTPLDLEAIATRPKEGFFPLEGDVLTTVERHGVLLTEAERDQLVALVRDVDYIVSFVESMPVLPSMSAGQTREFIVAQLRSMPATDPDILSAVMLSDFAATLTALETFKAWLSNGVSDTGGEYCDACQDAVEKLRELGL